MKAPDIRPAAVNRTGLRMGLREIRLVSGLVLGFFITTHFANHALGLVSLQAMEDGREWFDDLWRNPIATVLLYGSVFTHFVLALWALYQRRTLRMPARELLQLLFGLSLPFLLVPHVTATRIVFEMTGWEASYAEVLRNIRATAIGPIRQTAALVIAWSHFAVGLHFWLRAKPWYPRYALLLFSAALLVPVFALLGAAEGSEALTPAVLQGLPVPRLPDAQSLGAFRTGLYLLFALPIAAVLAARAFRTGQAMRNRIRVTYPGGRVATVPRGYSVLEASRETGIPHMSVCGGRGRCSTCRVRVLKGLEAQPPPAAQERATLKRIAATPNIRLACQFRPTGPVSVVPLITLDATHLGGHLGRGPAQGGREIEIAVLFCDLRGFTSLAEHRLPFDTVFILNRFFDVVGHAVEESGGHVDKFIGDGALALFGLDGDQPLAARQAFAAAQRIRQGIRTLNDSLGSELEHPLRVAIGLHTGTAIVGQMGYGKATTLTAIGDSLNTASRLEGFAKEVNAELVMSDDIVRHAGLDLAGSERQTVTVRGRTTPIQAWILRDQDGMNLPRQTPRTSS
ncbi:MAG: adenylate/guanylate cyclase domain-containing protein [Hyphomicrobiales bacterium]